MASAFQPPSNRLQKVNRRVGPLRERKSPEFEVGGDDEYSGEIDWDAEWQKVVKENEGGGGAGKRPGEDFYKSDAEKAAIRATNAVAEKVAKVKVQAPAFKPPEIRSLQGDWRVR